MILQEILNLTMEQAGLDADDLGEYRTRLIQYVNDGYMRLMLEKYRPWVEEDAAVAQGEIGWDALTRVPVQAMAAYQGDRMLEASLREDRRTLLVPGARDGTVTVRYRYRPQRLEFDADEPRLPEWTQGALPASAAWKLSSGGNQSKQMRSQSFRLAFEETFRNLKPYVPDVSHRKRFVNLYG